MAAFLPAPLLGLALASVSAAEPSLLQSKPASALAHELIELRPAAGHHFSPEAPQTCAGLRAEHVTARLFRCQLRRSGRALVVASVCDDAKTFCRQERFELLVAGALPRASREKAVPRPRQAPPGFLLNQPGKAMTLARREGKPLFVHFYGIWCPPCNMLEEGVYPTEEFQRAADGFVRLALDADAELSWSWKARFKVGGYPTLLVLDSRGEELARAVGYRSPRALSAWLAAAAVQSEPVAAAAAALAGAAPQAQPRRRDRVSRWRYERLEYAEAIAAAGSAPEARRWALLSRRDRAQKEDDASGELAAVKELTASLPDDPEFASWAADLALRDKAAGETLAAAVAASVSRWAADPALSESGLVPGDLRSLEASYWEALERETEARAAWSAAADAYGEDAKASALRVARGASLERAYCLGKAGRRDEARALYESLVSAYPDEFTFHFGYGRLLLDLGERAAALAHARAAAKAGYGDNWLRAVALEAKALRALGLARESASAIDAALASAVAPKSTAVRTHRYLAELRRLRAEL